MDLIRLILLQQETGETPPELKEYDEQLMAYNAALMMDAGFIEGRIVKDDGKLCGAVICRLTWAGHEFLDSIRDDNIWKKAKEMVLKPGMSWTFSLLAEFLKAEARRRLGPLVGLPPGP